MQEHSQIWVAAGEECSANVCLIRARVLRVSRATRHQQISQIELRSQSKYPLMWIQNALENIVIDNECKCVIVSESLFTAYAYRVCSSAAEWAEKADYSECLELISQIPTTEVTGLSSPVRQIFHQ